MNSQCICGSDQVKTLFVKESFVYAQCLDCDLVWIVNPPARDLQNLYDFYADNFYLSAGKLNTDLRAEYTKQLLRIEAALGRRQISLLDVGCGNGTFLAAAKERGHQVFGNELARSAAEFIRSRFGIQVFAGDFLDLPSVDTAYDIVVMRHVLEHVPQPDAVLKKARDVMKNGGALLIEVPNYDSLSRRTKGTKHWVFNPDHLYYFNRNSLLKTLERNEFSVISQVTLLGANRVSQAVRAGLKLADPVLCRLGLGGMLEMIALKK